MGKVYSIESHLNNENEVNSSRLKKKLFGHGLKDKQCENCNGVMWMGLPMPLELHHVDGNNKNNNITNLQILCPNCHSMTTNFRASNQKRVTIKKSISEIITAIESSINARQALLLLGYSPKGGNYSRICSIIEKYSVKFREPDASDILIKIPKKPDINRRSREQCNIESRKVPRPTRDELLDIVWKESVTKIAKRLGVSGSLIRKWAKIYKIPVPPVGWWAKFENNHFEECETIRLDLFKLYSL